MQLGCKQYNVALKYGTFDPEKERAESLARAGGLGAAAVRVLTSPRVFRMQKGLIKNYSNSST